jgi:hypothetical protein
MAFDVATHFGVKAKFNSEKQSVGCKWKAYRSFMESSPRHFLNKAEDTGLHLLLLEPRELI